MKLQINTEKITYNELNAIIHLLLQIKEERFKNKFLKQKDEGLKKNDD